MNYFGEMEEGVFYRMGCWLRSYKLSAIRRVSGLLLVAIGRIEDLRFRYNPDRKKRIILPDFFIAGAQKSGTTSLLSWISQLPEFWIARMKVPYKERPRLETQFFNNPMVRMKGLEWYSSRFVSGLINGEKNPEYMSRTTSLKEIYRYNPEARIIILLRNPVDRAYSAYKHYSRRLPRSRNWDWVLPERSFEDNLQAEEYTGFPFGFLCRGKYAEQLESVFRFFPREQVKIIIFERFVADPSTYLADIVKFLGGSPISTRINFVPSNAGKYNSGMDKETRLALKGYYSNPNEKLFAVLGYRIDEWN